MWPVSALTWDRAPLYTFQLLRLTVLNRNKRCKSLGMKTVTHLSSNNLLDEIGHMPSLLPFFRSSTSRQYRHSTLCTELALSKQADKAQSFTSTHCYPCKQASSDPLPTLCGPEDTVLVLPRTYKRGKGPAEQGAAGL